MTNKKYFPQFDSLRFFSIIAIILYHYITHRVTGGFLAVDTFFVLAGFLITRQLEKEYQADSFKPLWQTIHKRWKTIFWPMLFVILCGITSMVVLRPDLLINIRPIIWSSLLFVNNWQQILSGSSYFADMMHPSLFTHFWYLSVYFQMVVAWLVLFRGSRRFFKSQAQSGLAMVAVAIISAILMAIIFVPGEDPSRVYYGTDTRLFSFALGGAATQLFADNKVANYLHQAKSYIIDGILLLLFAGIIWALLNLQDSATITYYGGMFIFDIAIALLISLVILPQSFIGKLLRFKPTTWLGKRSYAMYLWYYPIYILYHVSASQNQFQISIGVQIAMINFLAIMTYQLVIKSKWFVPIFIRQRAPLRLKTGFRQLKNNETPKHSKILFIFFSLITIISIIGLFMSTSADNQTVAEQQAADQQARLAEINQQRLAQEKETQANLDVYQSNLSEEQLQFYEGLTAAEAKFAYNLQPTFIGDSLMLGASEALYSLYPQAIVDAEVGRQFYKMGPLMETLASSGQIQNPVVFSIGANGGFTEQNVNNILAPIEEDTTVFFVNTHVDRPWKDEVNKVLAKVTENPDDNIYLIDWATAFNGRTELLSNDQVHFNSEGVKEWLGFITQELHKKMPKQ